MRFGRVTGRLWATQKPDSLRGKKLLIVQPVDMETLEDRGEALVAVDTVEAGVDTWVFYVLSREATLTLANAFNPVDAAIVGIVDRIDLRSGQFRLE